MESIKYKSHNIKIENNKYNAKDIFKALNHDNYEDNDDIYYSLKLLKNKFNNNDNERELVKFIEENILMDIFTFIDNNDYDFKLGNWFKDIWYPLFEEKDILITNEILTFIYHFPGGGQPPSESFKGFKKNLIDSLNNYNIKFTEIDYRHEYVNTNNKLKKEIKLITPNNLMRKRWLILSVYNFKLLIMRLNTKSANHIREYYLFIENLLYKYLKYINEYNIKLKNKELLKANKKALMINKFMNNVVIKSDKLEWIYIASTDQYQEEKLFKIGSTERLHKRIKSYQTGRPDDYYYIWVKPCYNSKDLDYHIQNILKEFKYKSNKELYHGISIDDLIEITEFIIENYDKTLDYVYNFIKNKLQNSIVKDPIIKKALDIKSISYNIGNYIDTINIEEENNNLIQRELFNFIETIENKSIINRSDLINKLKINMNKLDIWKELKNTLKWKNSKDLLKYNNKEFYLKY
ncbi:N1R/p28-like protein [Mythimna separata entomopoxvirus 'L']|uniref:N1R/p28-like protein n=1 Tax=Mythimna separata entomopoxvirus 'L' TaxID=1293572 RepID=A0A916KQ68_9POXV|nr:N1R/p28-like protein [Mythimna separata entomopoxvirus 'L']CCU56369.1 N1R/p28-like protein [Mythimna separata entomopoxvirus 'L']